MQPVVSIPQTGVQNSYREAFRKGTRYPAGSLGNTKPHTGPSVKTVNLFDIYRKQTKEMLPLTFLLKNDWEKFNKKDFEVICKVAATHGFPIPPLKYEVDYICEAMNFLYKKYPDSKVRLHENFIEISEPISVDMYWIPFQDVLDSKGAQRKYLLWAMSILWTMGWDFIPECIGYLEDYAYQHEGDDEMEETAKMLEKEFKILNRRRDKIDKLLTTQKINWEKYIAEMKKPTALGLFLHMVYYLKENDFHMSNYLSDHDEFSEGLCATNGHIFYIKEFTENLQEELRGYESAGYDDGVLRTLLKDNGTTFRYDPILLQIARMIPHYEPKENQFIIYATDKKSPRSEADTLSVRLGRRVECVYRSYVREKRHSWGSSPRRKKYVFSIGEADSKNDKPEGSN